MDEIIPIRTRALNIRSRVDAAAPQQSSSQGTGFFIHGAMATLTQFDAQMACLLAEDQWNFVAYDHFGCGKSPRLEDSFYSYSTEEHFLDLLAIFDRFHSARNVLVGHSYGTSLALRLCAERPQLVSGLVLIAPVQRNGPAPVHPVFYLPEFVLNYIQPALSKGFVDLALHEETRKADTEHKKRVVAHANATSAANSMHVAKAFYRQISLAGRETVQKIPARVKFLFICGSDDKLTPIEMAKEIMSWLPAEQVKLEIFGPASHQVHQELPDECNKSILNFLNSL